MTFFWCGTEGFLVWNQGGWNWEVFCVELKGVELRDFWCGTEGVSVLNWGVFGVELRGVCGTEGFWGLKRCGPSVELMFWTEGVCVELRVLHFGHFLVYFEILSKVSIRYLLWELWAKTKRQNWKKIVGLWKAIFGPFLANLKKNLFHLKKGSKLG